MVSALTYGHYSLLLLYLITNNNYTGISVLSLYIVKVYSILKLNKYVCQFPDWFPGKNVATATPCPFCRKRRKTYDRHIKETWKHGPRAH